MPVYSSAETESDRQAIGRHVRQLRLQRGWRLQDLAERVSVSVTTLSAIENDKVSLDIDLLLAISRALDISLDVLLPRSRSGHYCIARRTDVDGRQPFPMKLVNRATGALTSYHNKLRALADPFVGKYIEPFEIDIHPAPEEHLQFISHHHEEFVFVLRGEIECLLKTPDGLLRETLGPGDCVYFWSYLPHCIRSTSAEPARSLHLLCSLDEPADSEWANDDSGPIYLMDASHMRPSDQIGGRIAALRRARGMSTTEFARYIGASPRQLTGIERGQKPVSVEFLLDLCRKCRKPKEYFLAGAFMDRPFYEVLRAREIGRPLRSNRPQRPDSSEACVSSATFVPLVSRFKRPAMSPYFLRLEADGRPSGPMVRHPGQEFIYVLKGDIRLATVQDDTPCAETLSPGDSCFLDSLVPHRIEASEVTPYGRSSTEAIAVFWHPGSEKLLTPGA